ncbi:hypothetical protein [Glacieibacterium sp.]|uniref:hypothetical protein n=1 Tax=Glacieibacterium sp. TaxID=2860237 RepID=UPI003B00B698
MIRILLATTLLGVGTAACAIPSTCDGQLVGMRVSKLKPGGSMAGFADAVRANQAWYASHGMKDDRITSAPVFETVDKTMKPSVTSIVSLHVYGAGSTETFKRDAAWDAFVAKYKANASIQSETRMCLPKGTLALR